MADALQLLEQWSNCSQAEHHGKWPSCAECSFTSETFAAIVVAKNDPFFEPEETDHAALAMEACYAAARDFIAFEVKMAAAIVHLHKAAELRDQLNRILGAHDRQRSADEADFKADGE